MGAPTLNVANGLTIGRILWTPVLVALLLSTPEGSLVAAAMFGVLALTDVLDGYLARSRGLITTLGKLLDPVADKLLVGGALVALVMTDRLATLVALVILGREALISLLRWLAYRRGVVIAAGQLGKLKMALQVAMVLALIAFGAPTELWLQVLVAATVVLTVASGLDYLLAFATPRGTTAAPSRA